jgi:alpha-glucosidase
VVLSVNTGHHVALARKKGNVWYLGVMGGDHAQRINLSTAFLGNGAFDMTTVADGAATVADAARYDLKRGEVLTAGDILTVELQRGGGYAARMSPIGR